MKRFFGGLLLAFGILILGLGGFCSVSVGWKALMGGALGFVLIPIVSGVLLIFAGKSLLGGNKN